MSPYQAVQLRNGALAARLADVPDLDAALAAGVDVARGVANGDGAHHLTVVQRVDLAGVARDPRANQSVRGKGHRLHLPVRTDVEGVRTGERDEQGTQRERENFYLNKKKITLFSTFCQIKTPAKTTKAKQTK